MFEDFYTTYSVLEPPKVYRDYSIINLSIEDNDILPNSISVTNNFKNYPGIKSPFEQKEEKIVNYSSILLPILRLVKENTNQELQGPISFEDAFQKAVKINPEVSKYKEFLIRTAKRESGFNYRIQNKAGAPCYGYFQMGKEEIKRTTGLSVKEFRNDPVRQILGAVKLYKINLKTMKALGIYNLGKEKGYSDDALVAGAWMGGPGGVKKYLLGKGDPSDSHWYGGKGGSSVGKIMNNWKLNE